MSRPGDGTKLAAERRGNRAKHAETEALRRALRKTKLAIGDVFHLRAYGKQPLSESATKRGPGRRRPMRLPHQWVRTVKVKPGPIYLERHLTGGRMPGCSETPLTLTWQGKEVPTRRVRSTREMGFRVGLHTYMTRGKR